ncbi:hypothetical protein HDU88_004439 [Geranomyces variabilis]|nr:hypothetical protein HDU88_004439 [Geranomyces variabilis]
MVLQHVRPALLRHLPKPILRATAPANPALSARANTTAATTGLISIVPFGQKKQDGPLWLRVHIPPSGSAPGQAAQSLTLLAPPSETIADFLAHLAEEFPKYGTPVLVPGQPPLKSSTPLPATSANPALSLRVTDFFRGSPSISSPQQSPSLSSSPSQSSPSPAEPRIEFSRGLLHLNIDRPAVDATLREMRTAHAVVEAELALMEAARARIEVAVSRWVNVVKWGGLAYLTTQLGGIMFLTQQLGWDLMEPVSYLTTVAATIFSCAIYVAMRRDPAYTNIADSLRRALRKLLIRRRGFDVAKYEALKAKAAPTARSQMILKRDLNPLD